MSRHDSGTEWGSLVIVRIFRLPVLSLLAASLALAADSRELDIHRQLLSDSLKSVADEFGFDIAFFAETTEGLESGALAGNYTWAEAFDALLGDTDLEYTRLNNGTVVIRTKDGGSSEAGNLRPASSPMPMASMPVQQTRTNRAVSGGADDSSDLEEIIVTGTRLRGINPASPVILIDRLAIERGGYTSLEDVFRRLPQSLSSINSTSTDTFTGLEFGEDSLGFLRSPIGSSSVNLRGLSSRATLVLVNGRRRTGSAQGAGQFTDISNIPLSQVERIEILTDGATAIYGADAVAGVVNIILRKDYDGGTLQLRHESSSARADVSRLNAAYTLQFGRGFLTLSGDYAESDPADTNRFIHSGPSGLGDFTDIGGINTRLPGGQPGIVFESAVSNRFGRIRLVPGRPLGRVPSGQDGRQLGVNGLKPVPAVAPTVYERQNIGPEVESVSLRVNGEFDLTPSLSLEVEAGYTRQKNAEFWEPRLRDFSFARNRQQATLIPVSNPLNRFGVPIFVGYSFAREFRQMRLSNEERQDNRNWGLFLKGDLPFRDWRFNSAVSGSREKSRSVRLSDGGSADAGRTMRVLNGLNLLTGGRDPSVVAANAALLRTLVDRVATDSKADTWVIDGDVSGPLFAMPVGDTQLALGVQIRRQRYEQTRLYPANYDLTSDTPVDSDRNSKAAFAEFNLPLLHERPFFHRLDLSLAVRHERFDLNGQSQLNNVAGGFALGSQEILDLTRLYGPGLEAVVGFKLPSLSQQTAITPIKKAYASTDPQLRLAWQLTANLLLRSTWGESYLVPQTRQQFGYSQLLNGRLLFNFSVPPVSLPPGIDRVIFLSGTNANLEPQEATTFTAGFDYTAPLFRGFKLSATYNKTDFENYIAAPLFDTPLATLVKAFDTYLGDLFHVANGVLLMDGRQQNLARRISETIDIAAELGFENRLGNWRVALNAAHTLKLSQQTSSASPLFVLSDTQVGPSDWAGNFVLNWTRGGFGVTSIVNYTSGHKVIKPLSRSYGNPNPRTSSGSYTTWDMQLRYDSPAASGFMRRVAVKLGVQNLLDADFPFVDNSMGFAPNRVNVRGRVIYLDLRKDFGF